MTWWLFCNSLEETQEINAFVAVLEVNKGKTKFLGPNTSHVFGTTLNGIKIKGLEIEEVDEFNYSAGLSITA